MKILKLLLIYFFLHLLPCVANHEKNKKQSCVNALFRECLQAKELLDADTIFKRYTEKSLEDYFGGVKECYAQAVRDNAVHILQQDPQSKEYREVQLLNYHLSRLLKPKESSKLLDWALTVSVAFFASWASFECITTPVLFDGFKKIPYIGSYGHWVVRFVGGMVVGLWAIYTKHLYEERSAAQALNSI